MLNPNKGIVVAKCDKGPEQQWLVLYQNNFNVIEKKGTKMSLNRRKGNNEIRLHKTSFDLSMSQFLAVPKLEEIEQMSTTENIDMSSLKFKTCSELPKIEHAIWECTQFSLLYSQCKIKCDQGLKFNGDSKAQKICDLALGDDPENNVMVWIDEDGDPMGKLLYL